MKIIIATHGHFGLELIESGKMIVGDLPNFYGVNFLSDDSLDDLKAKMEEHIDDTEEILVLTDIKGGSPFNVGYYLKNEYSNVQLAYGVNLPLVLTIATQLTQENVDLKESLEFKDDLIGYIEEE